MVCASASRVNWLNGMFVIGNRDTSCDPCCLLLSRSFDQHSLSSLTETWSEQQTNQQPPTCTVCLCDPICCTVLQAPALWSGAAVSRYCAQLFPGCLLKAWTLCLKSLSKGKILQSLFFFVCFSENKLKSSKYSIVNVVLFVLTVKKINDSSSLWQCWTPRSRLQDKMWCPATATNN